MAVARSLVKIDVDDARFKAYMKAFNKYNDALKAMPDKWSKAHRATISHAAALNEVNKKLSEAEKRVRKINETAGDFTKKMMGGFLSLLKFTGIGGVIGGALSGLGLLTLAHSVSDLRRQSMGYGVSSSQLQAMKLSFGRYVSTEGLLEKVANARQTGDLAWLNAMGIHPDQKQSNAEVTLQVMTRAKQMWDQVADKPFALLTAQGRILQEMGFTPDDLRRLHGMRPGELNQQVGLYRERSAALALRDDQLEKWQTFMERMDEAGMKIKMAFVDGLTPLVPEIQKFANVVADFIADFFRHNKEFQKFIQDSAGVIQDFTGWAKDTIKYLNSDDFKAKWHELISEIDQVAQHMRDFMIAVGWIKDPEKEDKDQTKDDERYLTQHGANFYDNPFAQNKEVLNARGAVFVDLLRKKGRSDEFISGMLAAAMGENHWLNPHQHEVLKGGGEGPGRGIFQWTSPDRKEAFKKWSGKDFDESTLADQISFAYHEIFETKRFSKLADQLKHVKGDHKEQEFARLLTQFYLAPSNDPRVRKAEAERRAQAASRVEIFVKAQHGLDVSSSAVQTATTGTGGVKVANR